MKDALLFEATGSYEHGMCVVFDYQDEEDVLGIMLESPPHNESWSKNSTGYRWKLVSVISIPDDFPYDDPETEWPSDLMKAMHRISPDIKVYERADCC